MSQELRARAAHLLPLRRKNSCRAKRKQANTRETQLNLPIFFFFNGDTDTHRQCLPRWIRPLIPLKSGPCSPWWRYIPRCPSYLSAALLSGCQRRDKTNKVHELLRGRSATPTTQLTDRGICPLNPKTTEAPREEHFYTDKLIGINLCLRRRHLVSRSLRHSQTDSVAHSGIWLAETCSFLSWDQSSSSNDRPVFAVVW